MTRAWQALLHAPSPQMDEALRTHVAHETIDLGRLREEHDGYRRMLEGCGVHTHTLDVQRDCPDAVFIEDTAIILDELAIVTSMGAVSRAREPAAIEPELRRYRDKVVRVEAPATIEGGDVLVVGRELLVGLGSRTNARGIAVLGELVRPFGYVVVPVRVAGCLHLKTACTALPDGTLLLNPQWVDLGALLRYELLAVHDDEPFAANVVVVDDVVCTGASSPGTVAELRRRGLDVRTTALSEIAKAEGAATCLSLLFHTVDPAK